MGRRQTAIQTFSLSHCGGWIPPPTQPYPRISPWEESRCGVTTWEKLRTESELWRVTLEDTPVHRIALLSPLWWRRREFLTAAIFIKKLLLLFHHSDPPLQPHISVYSSDRPIKVHGTMISWWEIKPGIKQHSQIYTVLKQGLLWELQDVIEEALWLTCHIYQTIIQKRIFK
jgi:hypothetical protein